MSLPAVYKSQRLLCRQRHSKKVSEESITLDKDLTADGKFLSYLFLKSLKKSIALSLEEV